MSTIRKRDSAAGGLAILAAAGVLCWKGLKAVDRRLRQKTGQTEDRRKTPPEK